MFLRARECTRVSEQASVGHYSQLLLGLYLSHPVLPLLLLLALRLFCFFLSCGSLLSVAFVFQILFCSSRCAILYFSISPLRSCSADLLHFTCGAALDEPLPVRSESPCICAISISNVLRDPVAVLYRFFHDNYRLSLLTGPSSSSPSGYPSPCPSFSLSNNFTLTPKLPLLEQFRELSSHLLL